MREIIFRGKREYNGEWIKGYYVYINNEYSIRDIDTHILYTVCEETVGQYTGLTDENGNRIFEGDIVSTDLERPYLIVEFRNGAFMFNCKDNGNEYYDIMLPISSIPQTVYKYGEVIGNIYDNPELLRSDKNG